MHVHVNRKNKNFREVLLMRWLTLIQSNLRSILDDRGIKYSHIAKKVNISKKTMSLLITNQSSPTYKTAYYIAKELNMRMEDIWYYD
jgi:DNA-binding XRE family transcriptional regulator